MKHEQKKVLKNTIIYSIKQIASVLFPLITFAYASRCLGVAGIGKVNYINSIANYFVILSGLGISTYAIRKGSQIRGDKEEINQFVTDLFLINCISTLISLGLYFAVIMNVDKISSYKELLICFSLLIPFTTLGIEWIYNIYEDFLFITLRSIAFQIVSLILLFVFVHDESDVLNYAWITVFATVGSNIFNFIHVRKYIRPNFKNIRLTKHMKPILLLFGMTIATTIYTTMDTTMLGILCNDYQVGLYSAAHKVSKMLVLLLATIRTVSLPLLSRKSSQDEKEYINISNKIMNTVIMIVVPVVVGGALYSDIILLVLSGEKYIEAVGVLRWLMVDVLLSVLSGTVIYQYVLLKKGEKSTFFITVLGAIVNLILNYLFIKGFKSEGAAIATCISELVVLIIALMFSIKFINIKSASRHFFIAVLSSVVFYPINGICNIIFKKNIVASLISMIICCLVYFALITVVGNNTVGNEIKFKIKRRRK